MEVKKENQSLRVELGETRNLVGVLEKQISLLSNSINEKGGGK